MEFLSEGEKVVVGIGLFWENKVRPDFPKMKGVGIEYGSVFVEFRKGCVFPLDVRRAEKCFCAAL